MLEHVSQKSRQTSTIGFFAYGLSLLVLAVIWLSETGNLPGEYNKTPRALAGLVMLVMTLFIGMSGVAIALLFALVPRKRRPYWTRFVRRLPFGMLTAMLFALIGSTYSAYTWHMKGVATATERDLELRSIPELGECARVHDGSFTTYGVHFEREGDLQTQVDTETNERIEYRVEWLDPCTYRLERIRDHEVVMTVHITNVLADGSYRCMVKWGNGSMAELMVHAK